MVIAIVLTGLALWWLFQVWLLALLINLARAISRPARRVFLATTAITVCMCYLMYCASWVLFWQSRVFIDVEVLRLAFTGRKFIAYIIVQASPKAAVALAGAALLLVFLLLMFLRAAYYTRWSSGLERRCKRLFSYGTAGLSIILVWAAISWKVWVSPAEARDQLAWARDQLNPAVAFLSTFAKSINDEPIPGKIRAEKLVPRGDLRHSVSEHLSLLDKSRKKTQAPSVLFLAVESLRADVIYKVHQGQEITPYLNSLARQSLLFTNMYSTSTHTDYAIPSYLSSLYPLRSTNHHYYSPKDPWPKMMIYDLLKGQGYTTAIITSDNTAWGFQRPFLKTPQLDVFFDSESTETPTPVDMRDTGMAQSFRAGRIRSGVLPDRVTMETILPWVREQVTAGKPFFLHSFFEDPHFPYELRAGGEHLFQPSTIDFECSFLHYPREKIEVMRNAYYNAVHETDKQIGRLLDLLKSTGTMENMVLVICGDHGEAFGENDQITHARIPIQPVVRIPCILHSNLAGSPREVDYPTELIDIAPTVCGMLGIEAPPHFQGIDVFSEQAPDLEERDIYIHVQIPGWAGEAIVHQGRWKLIVNRATQEERLYDLAHDETETNNIVDREPDLAANLRQLLATWRNDQLAYYSTPMYYENYYPPYVAKRPLKF